MDSGSGSPRCGSSESGLNAARGDAEPGIGATWKSLETTAIDGTTADLFSNDVLAHELAPSLPPGMTNLTHRGFFSMDCSLRFFAGGAHLAWRVKNGAHSVPFRTLRTTVHGRLGWS